MDQPFGFQRRGAAFLDCRKSLPRDACSGNWTGGAGTTGDAAFPNNRPQVEAGPAFHFNDFSLAKRAAARGTEKEVRVRSPLANNGLI